MGLTIVNATARPRIVFITGTDTGVGKTLLTGLLLHHLRRHGCHALAMKPFCSGGRADVRLLHTVQGSELTLDEINPFFFDEPLAPLVAARKHQRSIRLQDVLRRIAHVASRCQRLLIEGAGGLLVPLGEGYTVADLISKLNCEVLVVSANRLGTINHTLLTVRFLQHVGIQTLKVIMMARPRLDVSSGSNPLILAELLGQVPVFSVGFLGRNPTQIEALKAMEKKFKKTLAQILA
jgi:dethiobiotin synthetase